MLEKLSQSKTVEKQKEHDKSTPKDTSSERRVLWKRDVDVRLIHAEGELSNLPNLLSSVQVVSDYDYLREQMLEQQEMGVVVSSISQHERRSVLPPIYSEIWYLYVW